MNGLPGTGRPRRTSLGRLAAALLAASAWAACAPDGASSSSPATPADASTTVVAAAPVEDEPQFFVDLSAVPLVVAESGCVSQGGSVAVFPDGARFDAASDSVTVPGTDLRWRLGEPPADSGRTRITRHAPPELRERLQACGTDDFYVRVSG